MKKQLIYFLLALSLFWPQISYADIEAIQGTVLGPIKTGLEEARSIQQDLNEIQQDIRSAAEGAMGTVKSAVATANSVKNDISNNISAVKDKVSAVQNLTSDPEGSLSTLGSTMPGFATKVDLNDAKALSSAVQKNYLMQRPKSNTADTASSDNQSTDSSETTDLVEIYNAQEEKMSEIQRANFANLYAVAFSDRANLAKEEAEETDKENTRDIIQSTKAKSMEMAKRFRKIMLMNTMLFEYNATQQARQFTYAEEDS